MTNDRQIDLVWYARHFLFDEGLITTEELAALISDSESGQRVARLEKYDYFKAEISCLTYKLTAANLRCSVLQRSKTVMRDEYLEIESHNKELTDALGAMTSKYNEAIATLRAGQFDHCCGLQGFGVEGDVCPMCRVNTMESELAAVKRERDTCVNTCLDQILASLRDFPNAGGDGDIMHAVDVLLAKARAEGMRKAKNYFTEEAKKYNRFSKDARILMEVSRCLDLLANDEESGEDSTT